MLLREGSAHSAYTSNQKHAEQIRDLKAKPIQIEACLTQLRQERTNLQAMLEAKQSNRAWRDKVKAVLAIGYRTSWLSVFSLFWADQCLCCNSPPICVYQLDFVGFMISIKHMMHFRISDLSFLFLGFMSWSSSHMSCHGLLQLVQESFVCTWPPSSYKAEYIVPYPYFPQLFVGLVMMITLWASSRLLPPFHLSTTWWCDANLLEQLNSDASIGSLHF